MSAITAQDVKALRDRTGAGHDGVQERAARVRRRHRAGDRAAARPRRGPGRQARRQRGHRGDVQSYMHANGKIGVLVEVDCETDFVARNDDFVGFAKDLALHIAARPDAGGHRGGGAGRGSRARGPDRDREGGRPPENVRERIVTGKVDKWLDEVVLLRQKHVNEDKYGGKTIEELRAKLASDTGRTSSSAASRGSRSAAESAAWRAAGDEPPPAYRAVFGCC
jgi:elongation factor Ts